MARTYKPWQNRFSRSRSIATYLKRAIVADVITSSGDVEAVDSAQVQNIIRNTAVDSAAVSSISVDSSEVQNLIDSNYIRTKIGQDYIRSFIDGNYIRDYIDFDFVKNTVGIDSDYIGTAAGGGAGPTITSVTPTSYNGTSGTTITVNGTNFTVGTYVDFIVQGGTEYRASTTTLVSQSQVTAVTPTAFSASVDPISVKVTTNNGTATASNVVTTGSSPSWSTGTNLGNFNKDQNVSTTVVATDPQSQPVTYTVKSGSSLPTGLSLNSNTGVISGTLGYGSITQNQTVSSIITASDTSSNTTDRTFNFNIINTSNISMNINFPVQGDNFLGPTTTECNDWIVNNLVTHGNFDDLFSSYGTGRRGYYALRAARNIIVTYRIKGARGGYNYYNNGTTNRAGGGRDISGQFKLDTNNWMLVALGRPGSTYSSTSYDWSAGGGGGATVISTARSGYQSSSSYNNLVAIAAGGGGCCGGGYYSAGYKDEWSALPLDFPYRVGFSTGGRYQAASGYFNTSQYWYVSGGSGWSTAGPLWSTSGGSSRTSGPSLATYPNGGQSHNVVSGNAQFWAVSNMGNLNYTGYFTPGGFGGGGGTYHQRTNQTSSTGNGYHAYGGGGGGYYGGAPTSWSQEGTTSSITGRTKQYCGASITDTASYGASTNIGFNNDYEGAYSFAIGLENTGSYTYDGGSLAGTAPSAGNNGGTSSYYGYWTAGMDRPTDHGVNVNGDGYCYMTVEAA